MIPPILIPIGPVGFALADEEDLLSALGFMFYSSRLYHLMPQMATANSGWNTHAAEAASIFASLLRCSSSNNSDYIEWTESVSAGSYKLVVLYYRNTSTGKADLAVDGGSVLDTLDTYGTFQRNTLWTSSAFTLSEGSRSIRLTKNGKNASSSGYTIFIQHVWLVKQDASSALTDVSNVPHVINIPLVFPDSTSGTVALAQGTGYMFGTIVAHNTNGASQTISFWAPAGAATFKLRYVQNTSYGDLDVTVDGSSIGTINMTGAHTNNILSSSLTTTFATTGIHTLTLTTSSIGAYCAVAQFVITPSLTLTADSAPRSQFVWAWDSPANTNWNTVTITASQGYYMYMVSSGAQNDEITFSTNVVLDPGTYTISVHYMTGPNRGKAHILIDGVDVGNVDQYSAGGVHNVIGSVAGVTLAGFDPHTVKLKMSDKNASSSAYYGTVTTIRFLRTGA